MHSFADWRRLLGLQAIGPFAAVWLTRNAPVKRLLQAGLCPLQELWEEVNARLAHLGSQAVPATLAAFAPDILCLDETRLDVVGRYLKPFEVTVPLLVKLVPQLCIHSELSFERLVQEGRQLGLLRASPRLALMVPLVKLSSYRPVSPDLLWLRLGHAPAAPWWKP